MKVRRHWWPLLIMLPVFIFSTLCCVACTRQIKEIADIPPVAVDWGTALDISKLPTTVPVVYANGKTGQASVAWDTAAVPKPVHWSFQLRGLVQGTDLLARILVTVNDSVKTAGLPRLAPWELNSSDAAEFMELHVLPTDVAREVRLAWSPDEQDMVFTAGSSVYVWPLGEEQPRQIALLEGKGAAGGLHHPAWSYDKQYLIVHDGPGIMGDVVVLSYPEGDCLQTLSAWLPAYWSPDTPELLLAEDSGVQAAFPVGSMDNTTNLSLYDVAADERRVLLQGGSEVFYMPTGWVGPGEIRYNQATKNGQQENLILEVEP